jgi:hypothetical protein
MEYVQVGDFPQALASIGSDLNKHSATRDHAGVALGLRMIVGGFLNTKAEMEKFICGFN